MLLEAADITVSNGAFLWNSTRGDGNAGSITLNGVSLTVAELLPEGGCRIGLIPFTFEHTNLGRLEPGSPVNVEGDLIGRYVDRILSQRTQEPT